MHRSRFEKVNWLLLIACCIGCGGAPVPLPRQGTVRPGIDVLLSDSFHLVRDKRVGFVTNVAAIDANGVSAIARLRSADVHLVALFGPEHGLAGSAAPGERVGSSRDSGNIPIYSLYGATVAPTDSMLAGIDVMLVDLPDVGARYFTYIGTLIEVMQAAGRHNIPVILLDRPNPIGGAVQGNVLDMASSSMVGRLPVPMRHGLTLGEEGRLAVSDLHIAVDFRVVPVTGWRRDTFLDQTGLPFRAPSPNLQSLEALFEYPGTCLFEGTALSVGRGTDAAFRQVGAPWLDTATVLARLKELNLPGVSFSAVSFTPRQPGDQKFADTLVAGIRWHVTDRARFDPAATAVYLLAVVHAVHPKRIAVGGSFDRLAGGSMLRTALLRGDSPAQIVASWRPAVTRYRERVKPFLLYR